jgi:hypothetical protein
MIGDFISFKIFMISLTIGLLYSYINEPEKKIVYIYPSPENCDKIIYQDKANNCFAYNEIEVDCPTNNSLFSKIPIQL